MRSPSRERGSTLLDVIVGSALMLVVFTGISAAFKLTVEAVGNNKSRAGAVALATERIEFIRSLSYGAIGTLGGVPAGAMAATDTVELNSVPYTRRTVAVYADDPVDGLGALDSNGITADYKAIKVEVSWRTRQATRTIEMITRVSPVLIETAVPGGTLALRVINAQGGVVSNAQINVVNSTVSPVVDTVLFTDTNGAAQIIGAPAGSGYRVTVTKAGYNSSQTYGVTAQNTNPIPGHIAVADSQTTSSTFTIDRLSSLLIETFEPAGNGTWSDSFDTSNSIDPSSTGVRIAGDVVLPGGPGAYASDAFVLSSTISHTYLNQWDQLAWTDTTPAGTDILYRLYDANLNLVPNSALPGNVSGFTNSPINLSGLSTTTYPSLRLRASLSSLDVNTTPTLHSWQISYKTRPIPYPNVDIFIVSGKIIGGNSSGALIHKYNEARSTGASGSLSLSNMEFDTYTITIDPLKNLDISAACAPQPISVPADASVVSKLYLVPKTANSLLVDVRKSDGSLISGALVRLYRGAISASLVTNECGAVHFPNLAQGTVGAANPYSIEITAAGFTVYTATDVSVAGTSRLSVILTELP